METILSLTLLLLFATASIAFGFDRGGEYAQKAAASRRDLQIRLAKLDLLSYLLTSVPLVGGMMVLLASDPSFIVHLKFPGNSRDFVSVTLGIVASVGIGLGLARRRWSLVALRMSQ